MMNIQDRQKTLTAEGLRQRYNLDGLNNDRKSIQLIKNSINKVETEFQNYMDIVNKSLEQYQDQVEITTWFSNEYPTFEVEENHLGDLYYDRENGKAYRFNKTRNLFDKENANTFDGYPDQNSGIVSWANAKAVYIGIDGGKTYTISKSGSVRLRIATTENIPVANEPIIDFVNADRTESGTIETSADANYLFVYYYLTTDNNEDTPDEVLNTLQIEEGSTATPYTTYYAWDEIEIDKQVETLAVENSKADTSDNKRIVFIDTPTTPYTIGDVLVKGTNYYRCRAARESGEYSMNDWVIYTDYTDDMVLLDTRGVLDQFKTDVQTNYVTNTALETNTNGIYATVSSTYATKTTVSTLDGEVQNTKTDVTNINNRLSIEEGKTTSLITQVGNRTGKTTSLTQDVDEIRAEISEIADITKSAERNEAFIPDSEFQDIAESNPITIEIHPIGENISYLYPRNNLYPSDTLYSKNRILRFTNTSTNQNFDWELPEDLLYYDANVYDTLMVDYENARIRVLKKCAYNADGTVGTITPEEHNYDNLFTQYTTDLGLTQGDYSVSILGYSAGYIKVRLMALNAYISQYATKVELHSSITQTTEYIDLEVDKKVGKNEVIARINLTSEVATIEANKINIQGVLTAINNDTTTTIDGDKITTGTITANQLSSNSVNASKIVAGTITADKIEDATITNGKIANGTIEGGKIKNATITGAKIASATITSANIANAAITTAKIADASITDAKIASLSASKITAGTINANNVNITGTLTTAALNLNGKFIVNTSGYVQSTYGTLGGWTINANKLGTDRTYLSPDGSCQFYPSGGSIVGWNDGFRAKAPNGIGIYNSYLDYNRGTSISKGIHIMADAGNLDLMQYSSSYGVNIRSNCSPSTQANASAGSIMIAASKNITMNAITGAVFANSGRVVSVGYVLTDVGQASSKNTKINIKSFESKDYDEALDLLKNMYIYSYDYKYKLYDKEHQYGFIIDEIEKQKGYEKFFDFRKSKAKVNKDNSLDFSLENITKDDKIIEIKKYDTDVLDKYLLTCIKALQNKIDKLEEKINE